LWNKNSVSVMKTLLIEHSKNDLLFNEIIKKFDKIYNYEKSGIRRIKILM
jgi:DNA-directed RNA polymerase delta subunit